MDVPYPGARPFRQADHDLFFGRGTDTKTLLELWQDNRYTLLTGPGACGKTSLLNAGALAYLALNGAHLLPPGQVSYGSSFPRAALPEHNPYTLSLLRSWSPGAPATQLVDLSVRGFIGTQFDRQPSGPLFATIDHVDDLLADSGPRRAQRQRFLGELAEAMAAEPRLHLLLLAREEATAVVTEALGAAARYNLAPLSPQAALEAVAGPAAIARRPFDDDAAERLVADVQTRRVAGVDGADRYLVSEYVEPSLLQAACAELWGSLPAGTKVIADREVRVFGNVDQALSGYCSQVIASVADDHDVPVRRLRSWLLSTFVTDLGMNGTAYEGAVTTAGLPNSVARALRDRHLLTVQFRSGSRWYELLSDRLIEPLRQGPDVLPPAESPSQYLSAAGRALTFGDLDIAERYTRAARRAAPDTDLRLCAEAESLLGNIATEREKPAEAENHYRASLGLFGTLGDASAVASLLAAIGQTLIAQDRLDDAIEEFRAATARMPSDPVAQTDLALALWRLGENQAAITVLTDFLKLDGGNSIALRARGEILADAGEAQRAMQDLSRVTLRERPASRAAHALALARLGDQPRADRELEDAIAEAPRNGAVLLYAARAKAFGGDEYAAEELARRAVDATDPVLPPYHREVALQLAGHKHRNPTPD